MAYSDVNVLATTRDVWCRETPSDNYFKTSELLNRISKSPAKASIDGGDTACWTSVVNNAGTAEMIASGGSYTADQHTHSVKCSLLWKRGGLLYTQDKSDFDVYNKGEGRVINLVKHTLDTIQKTIAEQQATALWTVNTGTGNGWVSLGHCIHNPADSSLDYDYAGVDVSTYTGFAATQTSGSGASITISQIVKMINKLRFMYGAKADLIVVPFDIYSSLEAEAMGAQRHPSVRAGVKTELGLETFSIHGADVVADPYLDAVGADTSHYGSAHPAYYAGTKRVYVLSTDEIAIVNRPAGNLAGGYTSHGQYEVSPWTDLAPITGYDKYQILFQHTSILAVLRPKAQGVLYNFVA